ncbi:MAG: 7-cyano-7-deazaguanine synthase QueC [Dethiobacter sp.]|jgi:7-cyano-7-deazaguanine synthase|nr:7-cyano-7-deazaguanine synthase QueC [Dethiobacter sp.]
MKNKAVVLLSGGLDSTTCLSVAHKEGLEVYTLSFDYGQRHGRELKCASKIASHYNVASHRVLRLEHFGGSALTDEHIDVPEYQDGSDIPVTYVPARNILFLSYALGYAETIGADAVFIGVSAVDYSGYPDCRPEFITAFQKVIDVGTKSGIEGNSIRVITPLISLSKAETIKLATANGAPLHLTTSCYNGREKACGRCDSCALRLKGFEQAGLTDPLEYD